MLNFNQDYKTDNIAELLRGERGTFHVRSGGHLQLVTAEEGHSIKDIVNLGSVPGAIGEEANYTVRKISDTPMELGGSWQPQHQQRGRESVGVR